MVAHIKKNDQNTACSIISFGYGHAMSHCIESVGLILQIVLCSSVAQFRVA